MRSPARSATRAILATLFVALFVVTGVALLPTAARADTGETATKVARIGFDAVILRPVGFAVVVVGSAMFVPAAIITAPNGLDSITEAREFFVDRPAEYVFRRELGDF